MNLKLCNQVFCRNTKSNTKGFSATKLGYSFSAYFVIQTTLQTYLHFQQMKVVKKSRRLRTKLDELQFEQR